MEPGHKIRVVEDTYTLKHSGQNRLGTYMLGKRCVKVGQNLQWMARWTSLPVGWAIGFEVSMRVTFETVNETANTNWRTMADENVLFYGSFPGVLNYSSILFQLNKTSLAHVKFEMLFFTILEVIVRRNLITNWSDDCQHWRDSVLHNDVIGLTVTLTVRQTVNVTLAYNTVACGGVIV